MSKNIPISILGFDAERKNVPSTVEEINEAGKSETLAYDMAMDQWKFHSDYTKLRPAIATSVAKGTGVERESHTEKTAAGGERVVFDESEKDYLSRVTEMVDAGEIEGVDSRRLSELVQEGIDSVPVSFEKGVRGSGSTAEPAKKWLAYYDEAVAQDVLVDKIEALNNADDYTGTQLDIEDEDIRVRFALACKEVITKRTRRLEVI